MKASRSLPNSERLSQLMAVLLLAYASARFVSLPVRSFFLKLGGVYLPLQFNIHTIVSLLVAGLAATGTDWLLREHPKLAARSTYSHWLLPSLTAWIISLPLANLPLKPLWWAAFGSGAVLLTLILLAEYVSVNPADRRYPLVALGLSALAYGMLLTLAISLKALSVRLVLSLPALALATFLVSLRVQLLRGEGQWRPLQLTAITFIALQIAGALHYWPLSAIGYGLAVLGVIYALNSFLAALNQGQTPRQAVTEPLIALLLFWALVVFAR